jgi:alkanesulfonate monooxygenase SsuD/methylene tetrahydromethanopterin reductase-like flavin-dependent oxidoreductase (luciferase family)
VPPGLETERAIRTVDPHFGVVYLPFGRAWPDILTDVLRIESLGFDSLWIPDHLIAPDNPSRPVLEGWSLLAGLAAQTTHLRFGTLVSPAGLRNPAHLGKVIATVDQISGGRLTPGFGAGWAEAEYRAFNMPFPSTPDRFDQLREVVQFLRRFWREPEVTFTGDHVRVTDVVCTPRLESPPPLLIAAGGEKRGLRVVAEEADIWTNSSGGHEQLEHKLDVLHAHCDAVGRDPTVIRISQQCLVGIAPDTAALAVLIAAARSAANEEVDVARHPLALTGTPSQIVARIEQHLELGCSMFMLDFFGPYPLELASLFAREVLPRFRRTE